MAFSAGTRATLLRKMKGQKKYKLKTKKAFSKRFSVCGGLRNK